MCGRYASSRRPEDLQTQFEIPNGSGSPDAAGTGEPPTPLHFPRRLEPDFNVAPTKEVYAVVQRPVRHAEDQPAQRQLRVLRWGLIPSWAKDAKIGSRLINARMETVAEKPAFRRAFAARRCLLPADGYYEWYPTERVTKAGKPVKQPFFIRPKDGGVLAMAGLYEIWRDPSLAEDDPERFRWTATVLTTAAEDSLGHLHDRMPLMVDPDQWAAWLSPDPAPTEQLLGLLEPAAPGNLDAFPVTTMVNNVRNNGPELLDPLPLDASG